MFGNVLRCDAFSNESFHTYKIIKMKKILTLLLSIILANALYCQDILMLKNGDEIKVKVTEINSDNIKYRKWENQAGPTYTTLKSEIFKIKYSNGTQDVFRIQESTKPVVNEVSSEEVKKKQAVKTLEQYVTNSISKSEVIELKSFTKINGTLQNMFGQIIYDVEFAVQIHFRKKGYLVGNGLVGYWSSDFYVYPYVPDLQSTGQQFMYTVSSVEEGNNFLLGCKAKMTGSDNGFEVKEIKISSVTSLGETHADTQPQENLTSRNTTDLAKPIISSAEKEAISRSYVGELTAGQKNGKGKMVFGNGSIYEGEWKDDKRNGEGVLTLPNGVKYVGAWKDDENYGIFKCSYPNGANYEGEMKGDKREGKGKLTFIRGTYTGDWKDDIRSGQGELLFTTGDKYIGEFKDNKENGNGLWQGIPNEKGDRFDDKGIFKDGQLLNGTTTSISKNGTKYVAEVTNGDLGKFKKIKE